MKKAGFNENTKPLVSIIILNFNGGKHIEECIESIYNTKEISLEVILIDNNSSDNSQNICKEKFPEIILIQNDKNIGMAARNIGVEKAQGQYIVFLDFDTVVTSNWLGSLLKSFETHGDGLYQAKVLRKLEKNKIGSTGNMINIFGLAYARGKGETDNGQYNQFLKVGYPPGCCVFTSKDVIKKIGKVEEMFFAYHDDVDYGWRAAMLGIPSYYEPNSVIYHLSSPTLQWGKKKFFLLERNRWICLLSLYSKKTLFKIFPILIITEIGIFFYFIRKGMGITKIHTFFSLLKLLPQINKRAQEINKKRIVPDQIIIQNFVDDLVFPTYIDKQSAPVENNVIRKLSKLTKKIIS